MDCGAYRGVKLLELPCNKDSRESARKENKRISEGK